MCGTPRASRVMVARAPMGALEGSRSLREATPAKPVDRREKRDQQNSYAQIDRPEQRSVEERRCRGIEVVPNGSPRVRRRRTLLAL